MLLELLVHSFFFSIKVRVILLFSTVVDLQPPSTYRLDIHTFIPTVSQAYALYIGVHGAIHKSRTHQPSESLTVAQSTTFQSHLAFPMVSLFFSPHYVYALPSTPQGEISQAS